MDLLPPHQTHLRLHHRALYAADPWSTEIVMGVLNSYRGFIVTATTPRVTPLMLPSPNGSTPAADLVWPVSVLLLPVALGSVKTATTCDPTFACSHRAVSPAAQYSLHQPRTSVYSVCTFILSYLNIASSMLRYRHTLQMFTPSSPLSCVCCGDNKPTFACSTVPFPLLPNTRCIERVLVCTVFVLSYFHIDTHSKCLLRLYSCRGFVVTATTPPLTAHRFVLRTQYSVHRTCSNVFWICYSSSNKPLL